MNILTTVQVLLPEMSIMMVFQMYIFQAILLQINYSLIRVIGSSRILPQHPKRGDAQIGKPALPWRMLMEMDGSIFMCAILVMHLAKDTTYRLYAIMSNAQT